MCACSGHTEPTGCHRTTRADIRSHLYGGPQGWNPHSFGPHRTTVRVLNPSRLSSTGSDRGVGLSVTFRAPRLFALVQKGGDCLSPSKESRYGTRSHTPRVVTTHDATLSVAGESESNVAWPENDRSSRAVCARSGRMRATHPATGSHRRFSPPVSSDNQETYTTANTIEKRNTAAVMRTMSDFCTTLECEHI
jgi:hypothetical protein